MTLAPSPAPAGGFLSDLRGLSAEVFITIAGLVTSAAIVAVNFLLQRGLDLDLLSLTVFVVMPVGAVVGGLVAASGYYLAARATHTLPNRRMLFEMLAIALSTWFLAQWLAYALLRFPNGAAVRDVVPFWEYFQVRTEHMQLTFQDRSGASIGHTGTLGVWGYARELVQVAGFLTGGLVMWMALGRVEACQSCGRYARTRRLLRRVSASMLEDLLRRADLVLPELAERIRSVVGARRVLGLNLSVAECPSCHRHWVRPEAIVMVGAHSTVSALAAYDIQQGEAARLYALAP